MRPFRTLIVVATVSIFAVTACGDNREETATTTTTTTEAEQTNPAAVAYCERADELAENALPSEEQLQRLLEVAPPEIKGDVEVVAEGIAERGLDAFSDPNFAEAVESVRTWEADNCPGAAGAAGGKQQQGEGQEQAAPQTPAPDATRVPVTATDFQFAIEGDVPAEKVAFVMKNEGEVPHHMSILKLKEGTTAEQVDRSFQDATIRQLLEGEVRQSSNAAPGEDAVINAELEPGLYLMACFVDEPDGVPHALKGMRTVFEAS